MKGTQVLALSLDEASAKVRTGPPVDDDEDMGRDVWAGVLPLALRRRAAPDPQLAAGIALPDARHGLDAASVSAGRIRTVVTKRGAVQWIRRSRICDGQQFGSPPRTSARARRGRARRCAALKTASSSREYAIA